MNSNIKISYPGSEKVYMQGSIYPDVRVGMRLVKQMPTVTVNNGERVETPNPSVYIYDTSGPYSDENVSIDLEKALEYYKTANHVGGKYCTMCGPNFCAMKISQTLCEEK